MNNSWWYVTMYLIKTLNVIENLFYYYKQKKHEHKTWIKQREVFIIKIRVNNMSFTLCYDRLYVANYIYRVSERIKNQYMY